MTHTNQGIPFVWIYITLFSRVSVGYVAAKSSIVISLFKDNNRLAMEPFDRDILTSYAKDGDVLVLHEASPTGAADPYDMSAFFVVKQGKVSAIRLVLKSSSDPQATISEWPLTYTDDGLSCGDEVKIQGSWPAAPSTSYEAALPKSTRTGFVLENETDRPVRDFGADPNVSTGDSALIYHQTCEVSPEKYSDSSVTRQTFRVEFSVTNNSELDTSIVRTVAEYQKPDGSWANFSQLFRGYRQSEWDWSLRDSASDALRVGSRDVYKFALGARLELPAVKALNTRMSGVDPSLPVPLALRFTFVDQDGKSSVVNATCFKRGYDLPTLENIKKSYSTDAQKYWFVDDAVCGERFGAFYVKGEKDNYIRITNESSYYYLTADTLHTETYKACEAKETERQLTKYEYGAYVGTIHLLIDLEAKYAYGVRVRLACNGSTLDESFLLPKEEW